MAELTLFDGDTRLIYDKASGTVHRETNADRIRAMTDEELEKFLLEFEYHESNLYCMKLNSCTWDSPCSDCLREWLKKEVDDG